MVTSYKGIVFDKGLQPHFHGDDIIEHFRLSVVSFQIALPVVVDFGQIPDATLAEFFAVKQVIDLWMEGIAHPSIHQRSAEDGFICALDDGIGHPMADGASV